MSFLKKAIGYLLTYAAATIFAYEIFNAGIYFYLPGDNKVASASLINGVYLPIIYACFGLAVLIFAQTRWVKVIDKTEHLIYGVFNIVFFLLILALAIIMTSYSVTKNAPIFGISSIPLYVLSIIEVGYGVYHAIVSSKMEDEKDETAPKETEEKK
jgi:hypothetical protein